MNEFYSLIKYVFTGSILLVAVMMVLIALPKSRLRSVALTISGWVMKLLALLCLVYVISPLDAIPDAIPVAGYADDVIALLVGLASGIGGIASTKAGRSARSEMIEADYEIVDYEE